MVFNKALTVQEKDRINIYTQITNAFLYHQLVSASWTNHTHPSLLAAANCISFKVARATGMCIFLKSCQSRWPSITMFFRQLVAVLFSRIKSAPITNH